MNVNSISVSKFEMKEERIVYDMHEFVGSLFTCTVAFVYCSLSKMVKVCVFISF